MKNQKKKPKKIFKKNNNLTKINLNPSSEIDPPAPNHTKAKEATHKIDLEIMTPTATIIIEFKNNL